MVSNPANRKSEPTAPPRPRLVVVSGPPGVGKSTLCRALARELRATHLDKDAIDECFSPGDRGVQYTREIEPKVLQALLNCAELNLRQDSVVILDAPWTHILLNSPEWIDRLVDLRDRYDALMIVLELVLGEAELRKRIEKRGLDRDGAKLTDDGWTLFRRTDRLGEAPPLTHSKISAALEPTQILKQALEIISTAS